MRDNGEKLSDDDSNEWDLVRSKLDGRSLSRKDNCLLNGDVWLNPPRPR